MNQLVRSYLARFIALAMLPNCALLAQQPATKVAVVNGQAVLVGTREGKKALDQLKAKFDTRKKEFDARQTEIAQLEDQYNKSGSVMTAVKQEQLANIIAEKKKRFQRDAQDADDEAQRDQQQAFQPLDARVNSVISKYAADHGYAVVFDIGTQGSQVRYAATGVDITNEVIALYDKTYSDTPLK